MQRSRSIFAPVLAVLLILCLLLPAAPHAHAVTSGAGEKKLTGGQRDFIWPVPGNYGMTGCFLDSREHYAIDIGASKGTKVVASMEGTVVATYKSCTHNYSKEKRCCGDGFGNYVVLRHSYTLSTGKTVTLYSRYSHLTKVSVSTGQTVKTGEQVGTIGSTGYSQGFHLDFQILYGGWSSRVQYSLDPYINELMELPSEIYLACSSSCAGVGPSGCCCYLYLKAVRSIYKECSHSDYDSQGYCTGCLKEYDWSEPYDPYCAGIYELIGETRINPTRPYQSTDGKKVSPGDRVEVVGSVINSNGKTWYKLKGGGFVAKAQVKLFRYYDSEFECKITAPAEGQVLIQGPGKLRGTVSSFYPLIQLRGYIDGKHYASWDCGSKTVTEVNLRYTDLNYQLDFEHLSAGTHTVTIQAKDTTTDQWVQVASRTFTVELPPPEMVTVTVDAAGGIADTTGMVVEENTPIGVLPEVQKEGYDLLGWFTAPEGGEPVTAETVITRDTVIYAQWTRKIYTIDFATGCDIPAPESITVFHGDPLPDLPQLTREGYRLLGWYSDPEAQQTVSAVTESLILYAHWDSIVVTVFFDPQGGTLTRRFQAASFDSAYGELPVPVREGYVFIDWLLDGQPIYGSSPVTSPQRHTLVALWAPIPPAVLPDAAPLTQQKDPGGVWLPVMIFAAVIVLLTIALMVYARRQMRKGGKFLAKKPPKKGGKFLRDDKKIPAPPKDETPV